MNKLIRFSIEHPIAVIMYTLLFIFVGLISLCTISLDYLPQINDHTLLVTTIYDGLSAQQMRDTITIPIENAFSSLHGIKNLSSTIRDNCTFTKLELHYSTNINTALIDCNQIIDQLVEVLPENCSKPEVQIYESSKNEFFSFAIIPQTENLITTRKIARNDIKHTLQTIQGISSISIIGGKEEEIDILYDEQILASKNISVEQLANSILLNNFEYPAGTINDNENEYLLKTSNIYQTLSDIENTPLNVNDNIIFIKDLGSVKQNESPQQTFSFLDENECVKISIKKKSNSNPILLAKKIKNQIQNFKMSYPDFEFIILKDTSIEIKKSIYLILFSALLSSFITFLIIKFFFKNNSIAILLSLPIPICILFSVLCLRLTGKTLNHFSLSGISIAIGMLVDSSIVVIENIISSKTQNSNCTNIKCKKNIYSQNNFFSQESKINDSLFNSIAKVKTSVINSSMTTAIVFIPFFFFKGIFGELFSDLSVSVISAIIFSSIISVTLIPASFKIFFFKIQHSPISLNKITNTYESFLINLDLKRKKKLIKVFSLISIFSILLITLLPKEFITPEKTDALTISVDFPSSYSIEKTKIESSNLIKKIKKLFPRLSIFSSSGFELSNFSELSNYMISSNTVFFTLKGSSLKHKNKITQLFSEVGLPFLVQAEQDILSSALDLSPVFIKTATSHNELNSILNSNPNSFPKSFSKELDFVPDVQVCAHYGIPYYYISDYLYNYFQRIDCGSFNTTKNDLHIFLKPKSQKDSNLENLNIPFNEKFIPLKAFGKTLLNERNKIYFRYNKKDAAVFLTPPNNKTNVISLTFEKIKELFTSSIFLFLIAILLLYCLLGAQLESFSLPLFLLLSIIPGFTGALLFLFLTNNSLNTNSLLSLIVLSGISINNSIILSESTIEYSGNSRKQLIQVIKSKLRPVLITTITSICSLFPFIFLPGIPNSQRSMSIALTGGLIFALFSSLFLVPLFLLKK